MANDLFGICARNLVSLDHQSAWMLQTTDVHPRWLKSLANRRYSINSLGLRLNNMTDRVQLLMMPTAISNLINVANVFLLIRLFRLSNSSFALFNMPQLTRPASEPKINVYATCWRLHMEKQCPGRSCQPLRQSGRQAVR